MSKVSFNAPRGPFRMDPPTLNPILNVYIAQVVASGGGISTKILHTVENVQDPGKKVY
jgi:branched-chain amino acid transport system substrate-binding protein